MPVHTKVGSEIEIAVVQPNGNKIMIVVSSGWFVFGVILVEEKIEFLKFKFETKICK